MLEITMTQDNPQQKAKKLISSGAEFAGAAIGGALGFIAAGPFGAGAASALGVVITKTIARTADKMMSDGERIRVGTVAAIAVDQIREKIESGHIPRNDFFGQSEKAEEIGAKLFEGVLIKARDEYEDKKIQYLGRFFANLVFAQDVSSSVASLLIKTFDRLTYRQLVLLALIHRHGVIDFQNLRGQSHPVPELEALKREEMDLHDSNFGAVGLVHGIGSYEDKLNSLGTILVELGEINRISGGETEEILNLISLCPKTDGLKSGYES